jgi:hypothetical protein
MPLYDRHDLPRSVSLARRRAGGGASRAKAPMPKRTDIRSIMIIGAGPIVIGQACEFDYSGAQACKALREEGYRVILVNSNPATIMTDPEMAGATYTEPITPVSWRSLTERGSSHALCNRDSPAARRPLVTGRTEAGIR